MADKLEIVITASDQASGSIDKVKGALGGLGSLAGGALTVGLGLATVGVTALGVELTSAITSAMQSDEVMAQLNATLESTHGVAGVTADMAAGLATQLQGITRYSDETVLSGENMLLTFTNISKNVFPDTTRTMLDMSTAMGQDVKTTAIQLGKALQDPINGITALRRVGVNFTEQQQDMIKGMVEAGHLEEAQKMILKELQTEFGGSAEAAGKTFAGQLDILKNQFDDVQERIGGAFIPVLQKLLPIIMTLADKVIPPLADFLANQLAPALSDLVDWFVSLQEPTSGFNQFLAEAKAFLAPLMPAVNNFVGAIKELGAAFQTQMPAARSELAQTGTFLQQIFAVLGPMFIQTMSDIINAVAGGLRILAGFWRAHGDEVMAVVGFVFRAIGTIISVILQQIMGTIRLALAIIRGDWTGAWTIFKTTFLSIWNTILALFGTSVNQVVAKIRGVGDTIKQSIQDALDFVESMVGRFVQFGNDIVQGIIDGVNAGAGALVDTIIQIVNDTVLAVLNTLQIQSPSKVFANIGKQMTAGMALGITGAQEMALSAVNNLTQNVTLAAQSGDGGMNMRNYGPQQFIFNGIAEPRDFMEKLRQMGSA